MARFMSVIKGNRGEVSRLGSPKSGIKAYINGWDLGVYVSGQVDEHGNDVFYIYKTGGSTSSFYRELIAEINTSTAKLQDVLGVYNHV
jgi:hypothetical protein